MGAAARSDDAVAVAARPLRPVDHPYFDLLCELKARPVDHDLSTLQDNEEALGSEFARPRVPRREPDPGRNADRVRLHRRRYVDLARARDPGPVERGYELTFSLDPAWDAVRRFR